jgi:hypothetical protein
MLEGLGCASAVSALTTLNRVAIRSKAFVVAGSSCLYGCTRQHLDLKLYISRLTESLHPAAIHRWKRFRVQFGLYYTYNNYDTSYHNEDGIFCINAWCCHRGPSHRDGTRECDQYVLSNIKKLIFAEILRIIACCLLICTYLFATAAHYRLASRPSR